jgi:hypothetical protein
MGAGIYADGAEIVLERSEISKNEILAARHSHGAGMYVDEGSLHAMDSRFEANETTIRPDGDNLQSLGTGMELKDVRVLLERCEIAGNRVNDPGWSGGLAVYAWGDVDLTLRDTSIHDNVRSATSANVSDNPSLVQVDADGDHDQVLFENVTIEHNQVSSQSWISGLLSFQTNVYDEDHHASLAVSMHRVRIAGNEVACPRRTVGSSASCTATKGP